MTLWRLLILFCLVAPIGCSLASARYANVGAGGYVLAAIVGLAVGAGFAWTMRIAHKLAVANIRLQRQSRQELYFRLLYLSKFLWVVLAGFVGSWVSLKLLRLVFR